MDEIKEQLESLKNLTNEKEELDKNSNELQEIRNELQQLNKDASFAMPGTMQKELKNEKIKEKSEEYETKEKELKDKKEKLNGKFLENKNSLIEKIDEEMSKYKRKSELDQLKSTKSAYEKVAENAQKTIEKLMQDISEGKLIDQSLLANARSEVEENTKKAEEIGKELDGYIELESNIEQYTELEYLKTRTIGLQIEDLKSDLENKFIENNFKKKDSKTIDENGEVADNKTKEETGDEVADNQIKEETGDEVADNKTTGETGDAVADNKTKEETEDEVADNKTKGETGDEVGDNQTEEKTGGKVTDAVGFNEDGIHKDTGIKFNPQGYDMFGRYWKDVFRDPKAEKTLNLLGLTPNDLEELTFDRFLEIINNKDKVLNDDKEPSKLDELKKQIDEASKGEEKKSENNSKDEEETPSKEEPEDSEEKDETSETKTPWYLRSNSEDNKKIFGIKIGRSAEIRIGNTRYNLGKGVVKDGISTSFDEVEALLYKAGIKEDNDKLKKAIEENYLDPTVIEIIERLGEIKDSNSKIRRITHIRSKNNGLKNLSNEDISNLMKQYVKNAIDASENKEVKEHLDIIYDEGDLSKTSILSRMTFSEINTDEKFKLASRGRIAGKNNLANIEGEYVPDRKSRFFNRLIFKKTPLLPTANDNLKVAVIYNDLLLRGETAKINSSIEMQKLNLTELQQQELKELYESEIEKEGGIERIKNMSNPNKSKAFRDSYKSYFKEEPKDKAQKSDEDTEKKKFENIIKESQKEIGDDVSKMMDEDNGVR